MDMGKGGVGIFEKRTARTQTGSGTGAGMAGGIYLAGARLCLQL